MLVGINSGNKKVMNSVDISSKDILLVYKDSKFSFERAKNDALSLKESKGLVIEFVTGQAGKDIFNMALNKEQFVIRMDVVYKEHNAVNPEKNKYTEVPVKVKHLKVGDLVLFRENYMSVSVIQAYKINAINNEVDKSKKFVLMTENFSVLDNLITKF